MAQHTITNVSKGPRGVNSESGPVLIEPGQTVEVELTEAEAKIAKATEWFKFGKAGPLDHDADGKKGGSAPKAEA
jgi:hypothetical protein